MCEQLIPLDNALHAYEYTKNYSINEDIADATLPTPIQEEANGTKMETQENIGKAFLYRDPRELQIDRDAWPDQYPSNSRPPKRISST